MKFRTLALLATLLAAVSSCSNPQPPDEGAEGLISEGMQLLSTGAEEDLRKGVETFESCVASAPDDARCHAGLSLAYSGLGNGINILPPEEAWPPASAAAERAVELDEDLARAHLALSRVYAGRDWDWSAALAEIERAMALDPSDLEAKRDYAVLLLSVGRREEAAAQAEQLRRLESEPSAWLARLECLLGGDCAIAQAGMQEAIATNPENWGPYWISANIHMQEGEYEQAIERLQQQIERMRGDVVDEVALMGNAYGRMGRVDEARAQLSRLDDLAATGRHVSPCNRAWVYAGLGDADEAIRWLALGVEKRANACNWVGAMPYLYEAIEDDPRLGELLAVMALPD